jgi:hypothetical protein
VKQYRFCLHGCYCVGPGVPVAATLRSLLVYTNLWTLRSLLVYTNLWRGVGVPLPQSVNPTIRTLGSATYTVIMSVHRGFGVRGPCPWA